jgi:hypothetical protein
MRCDDDKEGGTKDGSANSRLARGVSGAEKRKPALRATHLFRLGFKDALGSSPGWSATLEILGPTSRRYSGVRWELVGDQSSPWAATGMRQRGEKEREGGGGRGGRAHLLLGCLKRILPTASRSPTEEINFVSRRTAGRLPEILGRQSTPRQWLSSRG